MQPTAVRAEPDARGGAVVLTWQNPASAGFAGVRVLRRERQYPIVPDDIGTARQVYEDLLTPANGSGRFVDSGLKSETVYYYAVVAFDGSGGNFPAFASSLTTATYRTADHLYSSLPELYQLYDSKLPPLAPGVAAEDLQKPQLRRLIELLSQPFDLLRSTASAMRQFHDVDRVDGALLPLLGQWIGHTTNTTLDLPRQRNEIRFAPHYARTVGIAANLRAAVNRLTNWDVRVKEFVHNVFVSNDPAGLAPRSMQRQAGVWTDSAPVNFEVAHAGHMSPLLGSDGRFWTFYHARVTPPRTRDASGLSPSEDRWHLFLKIEDTGRELAATRLTDGSPRRTHPCAVERASGAIWLFSAISGDNGDEPQRSQLTLDVVSAGGPTLPAELLGSTREPFALSDGDTLSISVGGSTYQRVVTVHAEQFQNIGAALATEVAALLERELPGVNVTATADGRVSLVSIDAGAGAALDLQPSTLRTTLGLAASATGRAALLATVRTTSTEPFALSNGDTLRVKVDGDDARTVVFSTGAFANILTASAAEVANAVNAVMPGVASVDAGRVVLASLQAGAASLVLVDVGASSAAPKLGFGVAPPIPPSESAETEPVAFVDASDGVWAFWTSRRSGAYNLWYSRCDGTSWAEPKPLTRGLLSDREPYALFDPTGGGRIWVFWTRKKQNGRSNVFVRTTTQLDFSTLVDADWQEEELTPIPTDYDNREPAAVVTPASGLELFFSSNRTNGWNVYDKTIAPGMPLGQGADTPITSGLETQRWPSPLDSGSGTLRLWFRSNATRTFESSVYPITRTLDDRNSGSTTADTHNPAKLSRRGSLSDIQRYSYDARGSETDLYARDVVGAYLTADAADQQLILRQKQLILSVIREFVPIQVRVVFLIESAQQELVYTYDSPDTLPQVLIGEQSFESILPEMLGAIGDEDAAQANVRWLRTWSGGDPPTTLPDLGATPPDLSSRLFTNAFEEES